MPEAGADQGPGEGGFADAVGAGDDQRFAFGPQDVVALPPDRGWGGGFIEQAAAGQYPRAEGAGDVAGGSPVG
jgi:hypothetical protein